MLSELSLSLLVFLENEFDHINSKIPMMSTNLKFMTKWRAILITCVYKTADRAPPRLTASSVQTLLVKVTCLKVYVIYNLHWK